MRDDRYSRQKQTEIDKSAWGLAQFSGFTAASGVFTHAQRDRSCDFHSPLTVWMVCSCIELVTHTCRWPQQTYCTHDKLLITTVGLCILLLAIICIWGFWYYFLEDFCLYSNVGGIEADRKQGERWEWHATKASFQRDCWTHYRQSDTAETEISSFLFHMFFIIDKTWFLHYPKVHPKIQGFYS